jgi:hypothetical protein
MGRCIYRLMPADCVSSAALHKVTGQIETSVVPMRVQVLTVAFTFALLAVGTKAFAQVPDAIAAAPGEAPMVTIHGEGAQIYECKLDAGGELAWQFREPIATLLIGGNTVDRHYAGPSWELADSSFVNAKVAGRAPGATAKDIPLLRLEVTSQRGAGQLTGASSIQRINTKGGVAEGACDQAGKFLAVPYSADYVFFRKGG